MDIEFRVRIRSVKDKRTGNEVRLLKAPERHESVDFFMHRARQTANQLADGIGAFTIVAFDEEMTPISTYWIADHIIIGPDILAAAVSEALRTRRTQWLSEPDTDEEEDPTTCA